MIYARIAALAALLAAFAWGAYADYSAGRKAGSDAIQAAWDKDRAAIQATADAAIATATRERDTALQANEAISNDYQIQLSASRANSVELAKRLLKYASAAAASGGGVSQGPDNASPVSTTSAQRMGQLNDALAATLTECANTRGQLNALQAELKPQL